MEQNNAKMYQKKRGVKQMIMEAYIALLAEKPYSEITVADIVKRAEVARVSFYRSFGSVDALLGEMLDEFYTRVTKNVIPMFLSDRSGAWRSLLLEAFKSIKEDKITPLKLSPENSSYLIARITRRFNDTSVADNLTVEQKYIPPANISIMFTCAKVWADSGYKESPEELAEFVYGLIEHNISHLR